MLASSKGDPSQQCIYLSSGIHGDEPSGPQALFGLLNENFFDDAVKKYQSEKYDEARFLFERNIVFNPKDAKSYLYLAKIYNHEADQRKEEYNLETALLIEPDNEEVLLMIMLYLIHI